MTGKLLAEIAWVSFNDAEAISDSYAWPARPPLTDDELREYERLRCLSSRLAYRARELGCVEQGMNALFGGADV